MVAQCGVADAMYQGWRDHIILCYELVTEANELAGKPGAQWGEVDEEAAAVLTFVALHEIGHALVDVLDLPMDRPEQEVAADEFAFLMMSNGHDLAPVRATAATFHLRGIADVRAHGRDLPIDHHHTDFERARAAVCMLFGRHPDPALGRALGDQASRCIDETVRSIAMWNARLAPHSRVNPGRTFEPPATR